MNRFDREAKWWERSLIGYIFEKMYRNLSWRPGAKVIPDRGTTYMKLEEHSSVVPLGNIRYALMEAKCKENGLWGQINLGSNLDSATH